MWYYAPFTYSQWWPVSLGSDEAKNPADRGKKYRLTLVLGIPLTGHLIIALWHREFEEYDLL